MRDNIRIVAAQLLIGVGLFVVFGITADPLPENAIPLFLLFLFLMHLVSYYDGARPVRFLLRMGSCILLFVLAASNPAMFPALAAFWLFAIMQKDTYPSVGLFVLLFAVFFSVLAVRAYLRPSVTELILLVLASALMLALRITRDKNRQLDERILSLTQSTRNMELEQKRTQTHIEQLRELYTLEERNRISRDLHDSVGHTLSAIRIQLEAIAQIAQTDADRAAEMARKLAVFSEEGLQRLRTLLHEMKPPRYSDQALTMHLMQIAEDFANFSGMQVKVTASQYMYRTTAATDQLLRYAMQEFLSNASRHGQASQVNLHLQYAHNGLVFTMKDNGVGSAGFKKNIGIKGIEERTRAEGGTVDIRTAPGAGFTIQISLPRGDTP